MVINHLKKAKAWCMLGILTYTDIDRHIYG